jgi:Coenzyme PQQ synthesis protein D (PqqD)
MRAIPSSQVKMLADSAGAVLLDLRNGRYYSLNVVATDVWSGLVDGIARDDLIGRLIQKYEQPADRLSTDIDLYIDRLSEMGLVDVAR